MYLNTETLRASRGGIPTRLLDADTYATLFSRMGLPFDRPVVIYSAGETHNIDATFLAWILAGFGHRHVFVLDGGFFKWQLEQRPVVAAYPRLPETRFPSAPFHRSRHRWRMCDRPDGPATPSWWTRVPPISSRAMPAPRCGGAIFPAPSTTTGRTI